MVKISKEEWLPKYSLVETEHSFGDALAEAKRLYDEVRLELSDWYHGMLGTPLQLAPRTIVLGQLLDDLPVRLDFGEIPADQASRTVYCREWRMRRRAQVMSRPKRLDTVRLLLVGCAAAAEAPPLRRRLQKYILAMTDVEIPGFYWSAKAHGFKVKPPRRRKRHARSNL